MDDYFLEFATVLKTGTSTAFQLDNQRILIPKELKDYTGNGGQRVILNYTPLNGDTVKVNNVNNIFTGAVQDQGFPQQWAKDPVKIQSVWVGGSYLNMIIEVEFHSKPHAIALLKDTASPSTDLYFSHSRNGDPAGYPQKMYASFSLAGLRPAGSTAPVPFRLFINTYGGMRQFQMELR